METCVAQRVVAWLTAAHVYAVWAAVGPLVGVIIGALLAARWQRKRWILDNKTAEYRGILDALSSYRFQLSKHYTLYADLEVAMPAQKKFDDDIDFAKAGEAVTNAFADRIFTRLVIAQSGARDDWATYASKILSDKPPDLKERNKMLDRMHDKLVKASQDDLKL